VNRVADHDGSSTPRDGACEARPASAAAGSEVEPLISVRKLSKVYNSGAERVDALRDVNLAVHDAGFIGIMGPSGSGKSTLLHLLAGLDRPTGGEIVVAGQPVHSMNEAELTRYRRQRIGIVFQQFNLLGTMTALDNIMLPGVLDGRDDAWLRQRATNLVEMLGLRDRMHHRPDALSGGEQQRVAIARALLFEPRVLFADEPTGNLDSSTSKRIWTMLSDLATEHQITILMVTHEPAAAAHCHRVFILGDGRVTDDIEVGRHDSAWLASRYQQSAGA